MAEVEEFATVDEIAQRLNVNPPTVSSWILRSELRSVRVGARRVRIRARAQEPGPLPGLARSAAGLAGAPAG